LKIELFYDDIWHLIKEYSNSESFGWQTERFSIPDVRGKGFILRFQAHGEDSQLIDQWFLDNIKAFGVCLPPSDIKAERASGTITLFWESPCQQVFGFDIYGSDRFGNPPFSKRNTIPVTENFYSETPPNWNPEDIYEYYIVALQQDYQIGHLRCESGSSDTIKVTYPIGVKESIFSSWKLFPNPTDQFLIIEGDQPVIRVQILNQLNKLISEKSLSGSKRINFNTSGLSQGIYFIRITTSSGTGVRKFIIQR
jgi:hypothetical protein